MSWRTAAVVLLLRAVTTAGRWCSWRRGRSRETHGRAGSLLQSGHERMRGSSLGEVGETTLFVLEVRTSAEEVLGVDVEDGDGVTELGTQSSEEFDDELLVDDGRANVT